MNVVTEHPRISLAPDVLAGKPIILALCTTTLSRVLLTRGIR